VKKYFNNLLIIFSSVIFLFSVNLFKISDTGNPNELNSELFERNIFSKISCIYSLNSVNESLKKNYPESEILVINDEVSVYPEIENLNCITKVRDVNIETGEKTTFTDKKIIKVKVATSTNIKHIFSLIFFSFSLIIFTYILPVNFYSYSFFTFVTSYTINLLLNPSHNIFSVFYLGLPSLIIYIFLNREIRNKFYIFVDSFIKEANKNKIKLFGIFIALYIPLMYRLLNFQYSIDYYLINYNYGFVKRGFLGTVFYNLPFNSEMRITLTSVFIVLIYIVSLYFLLQIFFSNKQNIYSYFMLFSPSFLLFPLYQIVNNEDGGVATPEIFGLFTIIILVKIGSKIENIYYFLPWLLLFMASVLIHEVNIFILPFALIYIYEKVQIRLFIKIIFLVFICLIVFVFVYFQANQETNYISEKICTDIQNMNIRESICDNAIRNLSLNHLQDVGYKYQKNLHWNWFTAQEGSYTSYLLVFFFSMIPVYFVYEEKNYIYLIIMSFLFFIPLFVNAWDWGRWFYLYFSIIYIYYLQKDNKLNKEITLFNLLGLILFSTTWFNSYCCSADFLQINNLLENNLFIYILFIPLVIRDIKKNNEFYIKENN
tara:strand:+ start:1074 stop:2873 length:1800 start_codon:yes stop_codon:yes gene_type:complete